MMDDQNRYYGMVLMSAVGGAVVSLWSLPWKTMQWSEIGLTLFVGVAFSIFGVPWLVADILHVDITPLRVACGVTFFGSAFGIGLIPILKTRVENFAKRFAPKTEDDA